MQYRLTKLIQKTVLLFSHKTRVRLFTGISRLLYFTMRSRNRIIRDNLLHVYGSMDKERIKQIQKDCYKYLMLNVLTMLEARYLQVDAMAEAIRFENREYFDDLLAQNKPVIIVTAHYGNIEILGYGIGHFITSMVQIQRKLDSSVKLTRFMKTQRESYGFEIIEKRGALRYLVKALKNKKPISLVVDQNVRKKDAVEVDFLGKRAYQTDSVAYLSRKFDAAILPVFMHYDDDFHYTISFKQPFYTPKTNDEDADIARATQKQADVISDAINADPTQWFWCHKRFGGTNKEIYAR